MAVHVAGLAAVLLFYAAIMAVGVYAALRIKHKSESSKFTDISMVAGRDLGLVVGIFTMSGKI